MENFGKPPKPTASEIELRKILKSRKIPVYTGQVIWYTRYDCFTPDMLIGKNLIIEVDGKVHDEAHRKTLDRIRQRALENMGYTVHRIKNQAIHNRPNEIANEIHDIYIRLSDPANKKKSTITVLKKPEIEAISRDILFNLESWAADFNKKLNDRSWSVQFFRESLSQYHPELIKNQSAMEKFILSLLGYRLQKTNDDKLDFVYLLEYFKKSLSLLNKLFPDNGHMSAIHLKNMFNESAPGFFKNLIFKGGPNPNVVRFSIKDKDSLNFHIDNFNKYLSELGITVNRSDIVQECKAKLQKISEEKKSNYIWLIEWTNID
jgi:hypothetical protein